MAAPAQAPAAGCNLDMRAAEDIANRLAHLTGQDPVVLALSAAAVPLGAPIADRLDGSLDLLLARNIAAPDRPDRVVATVVDTDTPRAIIHRAAVSVGLPASWIAGAAAREFQEIERQRRLYRRDRPLMPMSGRIAVVVDMSLSDPYRARAVFDILRDNGATRVIAAAPIAVKSTVEIFKPDADAVFAREIIAQRDDVPHLAVPPRARFAPDRRSARPHRGAQAPQRPRRIASDPALKPCDIHPHGWRENRHAASSALPAFVTAGSLPPQLRLSLLSIHLAT